MSDRTAAFWERVQKVELTGCWVWRGYIARNRYGMWSAQRDGKTVTAYAHRLAYELVVGPIPEGLVLDHLCLNRTCVNPDHLEPVTQAENVRRGGGAKALADGAALQRSKTHCPQGHPYSGDNLHVRSSGHRDCRTCARERAAKKHVEFRAANPLAPKELSTHCGNGHEFTPENTYIVPVDNTRHCRECMRERVRQYRSVPRTPQRRSDTCKNGHPFDEANTSISAGGARSCRTCNREKTRAYRTRKKAAAQPAE